MKIALSGKMQSGKTTIASYLQRTYGACKVSFADQLKQAMIGAGVNADSVYRTKPPIVRELLQVYGQVMRAQNEDHWIEMALAEAWRLEEFGSELIVIDDLRFANEAHTLREEGWLLVRVEREDGDNPDYTGTDISEVDLDDWDSWDCVIMAKSGDLMSLFDQIDSFITANQ